MRSNPEPRMNVRLSLNGMVLSTLGVLALTALLIQACSPQSRLGDQAKVIPPASRTIQLADGERVTVTRTKIAQGSMTADEVDVEDPKGADTSTSWCTEYTGYYDQLVSLFRTFRLAIVANDRHSVVALVRFPLEVNGEAKHEVIHSSDQLLHRYDQVFTAGVSKAIVQAKPEAVFCTAEAGSFANGVVWARSEKGKAAIEVVNR